MPSPCPKRTVAPRSLLDVDDLDPEELVAVLDRAVAFRDALPPRDLLAGVPVLNLFFEASTRTATSFSLAEQRVGADIISFAPGASIGSEGGGKSWWHWLHRKVRPSRS